MARVRAKASAYLVGSGEDGHEPTQHGGADAGDVDEGPLAVTDRDGGVALSTSRPHSRGLKVGHVASEQINHGVIAGRDKPTRRCNGENGCWDC